MLKRRWYSGFSQNNQHLIYFIFCILFISLAISYAQEGNSQPLVEIFQDTDQKKDWLVLTEPEFYSNQNIDQLSTGSFDYLRAYEVHKALRTTYLYSKDSLKINMKIYLFPSHIHAFGFYSVDKSPSLDFYDIGFETYAFGQRLVCWYGNFVIFAEKQDTLSGRWNRLRDFTEEITKIIPKQKKRTPVLDCLPEKNRVENSEKFYLGPWLGQDYFKKIYYADYKTDQGYSRIFIIDNIYTAAADSNFWNYYFFFQENVEVILDTLKIDTDYYVINEPLWGRVILAKKNQIIYGILDYRDKEWTEDRLAEVLEALKKREIVKPG
jgi:hypothetical protein